MNVEKQLVLRVGNKSVQVVLADDDLWFSQSCLAAVFETTTQNVNLHLAKLIRGLDVMRTSRFISVAQIEGCRSVSRKIRHFSFESVHAIAIRAQRFVELNALVEIAARFGVLKKSYRIVPVQERNFAEALTTTLQGIASIDRQFRVMGYSLDFFLPEYDLAVEYDEPHHSKPAQSKRDKERQKQVASKLGLKFIRVRQGKEFQGINRILRYILSRPKNTRQIINA